MFRELDQKSVLAQVIREAEQWGANEIEVEYQDGYEEIFIRDGKILFGIERFKSTSKAAEELRKGLYDLRKVKNIKVLDQSYKVNVDVYNSFGEDAFKFEFQRI